MGVDTTPRGLRSVSWPWLRNRILAILATPPAGFLRVPVDEKHERFEPFYRTRIQTALFREA